jgi:hypothetical protein
MSYMENLNWRKSSYSGPNGGECVEIGQAHDGAVLVRDTKSRQAGRLALMADEWRAFVVGIKAGTETGR